MTASFNGHVDIVRTLIEAEVQVNTQEEVCCPTSRKTLHSTSHRHTVLLCIAYYLSNSVGFLLLSFMVS